jgi:hypothetical protein
MSRETRDLALSGEQRSGRGGCCAAEFPLKRCVEIAKRSAVAVFRASDWRVRENEAGGMDKIGTSGLTAGNDQQATIAGGRELSAIAGKGDFNLWWLGSPLT